MDGYRSFIHSCQNIKATNMSLNRNIDKHPHHGCAAVENCDCITKHHKRPRIQVIKQMGSVVEHYIFYDYSSMTFWQRQNYRG